MGYAEELDEVRRRLASIEARQEQLFQHLDLRPRESPGDALGFSGEGEPPDPTADPEIQDLLAKGNEIQAIKRYHELTGVGLKEAKDAIDRAKPAG